MIICNQCGFICAETARSCGECGAAISFAQPPPPPIQPQPYRSPYSSTPVAPAGVGPSTGTNHLLWIVPLGILMLVLVITIGLTASRKATSSSVTETNSRPATPAATPYSTGRLVYCRFNGVHVRDSPNLNAFIITDIQQGQAIRVFRESSNYDTVSIRSINQTVTDNWSEIQIENTSVRGWVFSGFLC